MRPIQDCFFDLTCTPRGFSRQLESYEIYQAILTSLDYRLEVIFDFGRGGESRASHGHALALYSKANQRKWGFVHISRGCTGSEGCDVLLRGVNTWEQLSAVRDTIISRIVWQSGEEILNYFHTITVRDISPNLSLVNYAEFLQTVNRVMI